MPSKRDVPEADLPDEYVRKHKHPRKHKHSHKKDPILNTGYAGLFAGGLYNLANHAMVSSDKADTTDSTTDRTPTQKKKTSESILSADSGVLLGIWGLTPYFMGEQLAPWARTAGLAMVSLGGLTWWMGNFVA